jgi:phage/plasmid-associated DNA primase
MATGNPRICEFLYCFGCGSSGKDVMMLLILNFFGEHPDNYGCMLNGEFLVDSGTKASKEGPSPFLAGTQGKRFVWVSEVPQHKNLQVNLIKQYCEMSGAPITARKLYKAPVTFRPTGVICATSNFAPTVTVKDDSGFTRRARIWATTQTFAVKPTKITEVKADALLKQRIQAGFYNPQLLWLVKGLVATLTPDVNPATTLEPRPPSMKHLEEESQEGGLKDEFLKFVKDRCMPTTRKGACKIKDFKAEVATSLGVSKPQVGLIMQEAGYKKDGESNGGDRVAVGHHPDRTVMDTDGLALKAASLL